MLTLGDLPVYPGEGETSAFGEEVPPPFTKNRFPKIKKGRVSMPATELDSDDYYDLGESSGGRFVSI